MVKKYAWNSVISAVIWSVFNGFFLLVCLINEERLREKYPEEYFRLLPGESWSREISQMYLPSFLVMLALLIFAMVGLYFFGKKWLALSEHVLPYVFSVFTGHAVILLLLFLAVRSEHTMISTVNWFADLLLKAIGANYPIAELIYSSFLANAVLSLLPYGMMVLGLYRQGKTKLKTV